MCKDGSRILHVAGNAYTPSKSLELNFKFENHQIFILFIIWFHFFYTSAVSEFEPVWLKLLLLFGVDLKSGLFWEKSGPGRIILNILFSFNFYLYVYGSCLEVLLGWMYKRRSLFICYHCDIQLWDCKKPPLQLFVMLTFYWPIAPSTADLLVVND